VCDAKHESRSYTINGVTIFSLKLLQLKLTLAKVIMDSPLQRLGVHVNPKKIVLME
jgi:hypothetical protein